MVEYRTPWRWSGSERRIGLSGERHLGGVRIDDQRWRQHEEAAPLVLPAATGGAGALTYALTPALPAGLAFDPAARTVSGTPSAPSSSATYTYAATDSAVPPSTAGLTFTIDIEASAEDEALRRPCVAVERDGGDRRALPRA